MILPCHDDGCLERLKVRFDPSLSLLGVHKGLLRPAPLLFERPYTVSQSTTDVPFLLNLLLMPLALYLQLLLETPDLLLERPYTPIGASLGVHLGREDLFPQVGISVVLVRDLEPERVPFGSERRHFSEQSRALCLESVALPFQRWQVAFKLVYLSCQTCLTCYRTAGGLTVFSRSVLRLFSSDPGAETQISALTCQSAHLSVDTRSQRLLRVERQRHRMIPCGIQR